MCERVAQECFYAHIIPLLLWDDVLHFCNTNRASLVLVNKHTNMCVKHWTFPRTYIQSLCGGSEWQKRCAETILTSMILYEPRKWMIRGARNCGKTFFAMMILNKVLSSQYITRDKRSRELVKCATSDVPLSYHAFQLTILDIADRHKEDYNYDKFLHHVIILTSDVNGVRRNTQKGIPNCTEIILQ